MLEEGGGVCWCGEDVGGGGFAPDVGAERGGDGEGWESSCLCWR